jgi:hypothetical protein
MSVKSQAKYLLDAYIKYQNIHQEVKHLVLERIEILGLSKSENEDYFVGMCCIALNQFPPRYSRFKVDMSFYLHQSERQQMEMNVLNAVSQALSFLYQTRLKKKQ